MARLTDSQRTILAQLIFHESFENLMSETGFQYGVIRDDLMQLMHAGMIEIFSDSDHPARLMGYDSDRLQAYLFRVSRKGLNEIQHL